MQTDKANKAISEFVKTAEESFGSGVIIVPELGLHMVNEKPEVIKTGCDDLDRILGIGGLPKGRIVEILGSEASGKSTLALHIIANAQKEGLKCALIDTENSLDRVRATSIGVEFDKLAISQPDNAEQALELLDMMVNSKVFGVVVLDSVAALVPKAEIEGDMSDAIIGVQARLMGKIMRKIVSPANKNKVLVIFTNQIRMKVGGFTPFPVETTSGGNALKFYASVRIDMRKTGTNNTKILTTQHKITVKKNKLAPPMDSVSVKIGDKGFINE